MPKVESSFMDELNKTLREGFTAAELAGAKKSLQDSRVGNRSSDGGVLGLIAQREQFGRTLAWDQQMDAKLAAVTLAQVNAAFRKYIDPARIAIVKGGDFKAARVYQ
jgi:zinc protease